jgi:carbamoyl-phosphate synthase large subunit
LPESTIDKDYEKLSNFVKQVGFPLIVKPRSGSGSKDLHIVNNMKSLFHFMNLDISMIAQRVVGSKDDEYTVGVIGTESGDILDLIVLKRLLKSGLTSMAKVVKNHKIEDYAKSIVSLLKPRGYCNVQLRLENGNPYVFEVNGRISSSTGFRTTAGLNEPEIIIKHYILKEKISPSKIKNVRLVRINDEIII